MPRLLPGGSFGVAARGDIAPRPAAIPLSPERNSHVSHYRDLRARHRYEWLRTEGSAKVYARVRPKVGQQLAHQGTDLVIEGFPRSGNTYAVASFRRANGVDLQVASHLHAPANLLAGARLGIPSILLVRDPFDAVVSYMQREAVSAACALRLYIRFTADVLPNVDGYVVVPFPLLTHSFKRVVEVVNHRFGCAFRSHGDTREDREWVRARLVRRSHLTDGWFDPMRASVPTPERHAQRSLLREELTARGHLAEAALRAYEQLLRYSPPG